MSLDYKYKLSNAELESDQGAHDRRVKEARPEW